MFKHIIKILNIIIKRCFEIEFFSNKVTLSDLFWMFLKFLR